jgi:DNA invertase Pin-like site-specific DNA recombinase
MAKRLSDVRAALLAKPGVRAAYDELRDEFELADALIRARTGEGRAGAKARGVKLGRRPKLTLHQKREALERRERGDERHAEIGRSYNVSGWTISRLTA